MLLVVLLESSWTPEETQPKQRSRNLSKFMQQRQALDSDSLALNQDTYRESREKDTSSYFFQ